jgi:hypothetical protein
MSGIVTVDQVERLRPAVTPRFRRGTAVFLGIALGSISLVPATVTAQDGSEAAFRPACDLLDPAQVAQIVGVDLSASQMGPQSCIWEGAGLNVIVSLLDTADVATMRIGLPGATDLVVAGREALSSAGGEGIPATVVVGLDGGGVILVQVAPADDVPADPIASASALAEAIFAGGPVLARPPQEASGPALGYEGDICDLVTVAELNHAIGEDTFATAMSDSPETCSYTSDDFSIGIVGIIYSELFLARGDDTEDLTVGGRPAVWSPQALNSLLVDIGGGRTLQVAFLGLDLDTAQLRDASAAAAELVVSRLVPIEEP